MMFCDCARGLVRVGQLSGSDLDLVWPAIENRFATTCRDVFRRYLKMQPKSIHRVFAKAHLLLALLAVAPAMSFAVEHDSDDATLRRQAMYEWYTDDYSHHGEPGFANHKQMYFPAEYERFLNQIAQRERNRFAALLPGLSKQSIGTNQAVTTGNWVNIGPDHANFEQNGVVLNVTDSGRANVILTDPNNSNIIYVGFSGGGVWKSTDGGSTWTPKTETLGSLSVGTLEMDPSNSSTLYLGLGDPFDGTGIGLVKSTDGGDTWSSPVYLGNTSVIPDIEVARSNNQIVLAATNAGLYRSTNGGASFSKVTINTGQAADPYVWTIAWGGGDTFVLGLEAAYLNSFTGSSTLGQIWRSTDNGATWTQSTGVTNINGSTDNGVGRLYIAAAPSNRGVMYAEAANQNEGLSGTDFADIFKSIDNGITWTGMGKTAVNGSTYKSYTNPNSDGSDLSTILNGQGWYNQLVLVDPTNPNVAYFGGALLLAKTSDGGSTYSQVSNWLAQFSLPYVHADFHGGTITSGGTLYVGTDGGIFRSTDSAATFTDTLNNGIASHLVYQVGSSTNNTSAVVIGLQDDGTRVRVNSTTTFNQIIGGDGFGCDVNQGNATQMLGSLYYDQIYRSTNSGTSFSSACSGITDCNSSSKAPFRTVLSRWAGDTTGNTVYTFSNAKVYKTTNYASSWAALGRTGLPAITIPASFFIRGVGTAKTNGSIVGIVSNGGNAYLTTNGGSSWSKIGTTSNMPGNGLSLSSITFDPTNASIIYIASVAPSLTATHLWRSANSGTSWTAIDGAASGFPTGVPVNSLFVDPVTPTTLYAATQLGVYVSSDSGNTWTRYGAGMPLVNVTDLYLASDDSLIRAGTFGRSVWEFTPVPATIGGSVSGLSGANTVGLTLTDTTTSGTQVQSYGNGSFTFPTALNSGDSWNVVVTSQPTGQTCVVANGSGTNLAGPVTNVTVTCTTNTYTLTYTAGANGTISGMTPQTVSYGGNGTAVTGVPSAGHHFVQWSDASTANPRTDTNVTSNINVTAQFAANVLVFTTQPANVVAPSTLNTIAVTEQDGSGNTITSDNTTSVNFTVSACGGTALGSATMSGGVATLSPAQVFSTLRAGLTVSASAPTLSLSTISQSFNVDNASPSDLVFIDGFETCTL